MFFNATTFLGIDPTAGQRPFSYVALDHELRLLALGQCDMNEVLAFAAGQRQAVVAVNSPRQPNQGLMQQEDVRQSLHPTPRPGRWSGFRLAEYMLRQHNITTPQTYPTEDECPRWMQMGFSVFQRLESMGYILYPSEGAPLQYLEVYPHASYAALLGVQPLPKNTLEGRLQRQLALYEQKLKIPDPMNFFEEITRHRLLKGKLPLEHLYSAGELDALVAAFTAWVAGLHPEQLTLVGDRREGQIALPVGELKDKY